MQHENLFMMSVVTNQGQRSKEVKWKVQKSKISLIWKVKSPIGIKVGSYVLNMVMLKC